MLLCFLAAMAALAAGESRFGTVGKTPEFAWHRFYNADWTWLESPANPRRLYTLAKLDRRSEPHLQWCRDASPILCRQRDPAAQRRRYDSIFAAERGPMARIFRHHNAINPSAPPPLYVTIGNEPNVYPYVEPEVYAETYKRYRDYLRDPAPAGLGCGHCRVLTGGILLYDPVPRSFLPGRWLRNAVGIPGYLEWTRRFLERLHALGGQVDVFDVHVYCGGLNLVPIPFLGTSLARWQADTSALDEFLAVARAAPGGAGKAAKVWIGEFGSLQPLHSEADLAGEMRAMVSRFRRLPAVERWFWFKHAGRDVKTSLAPLCGLYRNPGDTATRTLLGRTYLEMQREEQRENSRGSGAFAESGPGH